MSNQAWSDPDVPLVVFDLASVETYFLVRALSGLAVEEHGARWCPLISGPAQLDLDIEGACGYAKRSHLPFVRPERHPAPVPRAMRLATLAAARGHAAIFTIRATRLAWSTATDLGRLAEHTDLNDGDQEDDLDEYLRLIVQEIGVDVEEAKAAAEDGSDWDLEMHSIAGHLAQLGTDAAPALRWGGTLYSGQAAIAPLLARLEGLGPPVE